jgi:hypothetical protein
MDDVLRRLLMFTCCSAVTSVGFLVVAEGGGEGIGAAFLVIDAIVIAVASTELWRTRPQAAPRGYPAEAANWTKKYQGYTVKGGQQ